MTLHESVPPEPTPINDLICPDCLEADGWERYQDERYSVTQIIVVNRDGTFRYVDSDSEWQEQMGEPTEWQCRGCDYVIYLPTHETLIERLNTYWRNGGHA